MLARVVVVAAVFAAWVVAVAGRPLRDASAQACTNQRHAFVGANASTIAFVDSSPSSFLELGEPTEPKQTKFKLECQCDQMVPLPTSLKLPMEISPSTCATSEVKVMTKQLGEGFDPVLVQQSIGSALRLQWARVAFHHFSDWGGHTNAKILGFPGGDMVEFISALSAFEKMTNVQLTDHDVLRLLKKFLGETKKVTFYLMTTTPAMQHMAHMLGLPNADVREPPLPQHRETLLAGLSSAEHVGCPMLRDLVANPNVLGVRPSLPKSAIRAFFTVLWNKESFESRKLRLVEADELRAEKALVIVKTSPLCLQKGVAPLVQPTTNEGGMFVVHPDAVTISRAEMCEFFAVVNEKMDASKMEAVMADNGVRYLNRAIQLFAGGIPVYEVVVV